MIMTLNEILTKQNVFTKLVLHDGEKELPKALKVKIMRIRMAYAKTKKAFDDEVQEFTKELVPQELIDLNDKQDKTDADNTRIEELTNIMKHDTEQVDDYNF
jgi:hypothetical protein